jgi:RNA polymerase sigma factor (sigma-70 family)
MVDRAALDIYIRRIGKWHASAAAKRLGAVALELERLIYRAGCTADEAVAAIRREHPDVGTDELNEILRQIPQRNVRDGRPVPIEAVEHTLCVDEDADVLVIAEERRKVSERAAAVIRRCLADFDDTDRLVFQMRFEADLRLADIARMLGIDTGRLYRRHQELLKALREAMESDSITAGEAADLIGHLSDESDFGLRKMELRPSKSERGVDVREEIQK